MTYCTKHKRSNPEDYTSGLLDFFQLNADPEHKSIDDTLRGIHDRIIDGEVRSVIALEYPRIFQQYNVTIRQWYLDYYNHVIQQERITSPRGRYLRVYWFYGKPSSGKTTSARASINRWCNLPENSKCPGIYQIIEPKWIDGYIPGQVVLFDDFRYADLQRIGYTFNRMLHFLSPYSIILEIKGGHQLWNPPVIFITSYFDPISTFHNSVGKAREDMGQIIRRIHGIFEFRIDAPRSESPEYVQEDMTKTFYEKYEIPIS